MVSIFKREFFSYFNSPLGYVFLTAFYFFSGMFFYVFVLVHNSTRIGMICENMFQIVLFVVPIITMRLLSEEKRQKTDQVLLTSPISLTSVVYGKFLAACSILAIGTAVTLIYAFVISAFSVSSLNWLEIFGNILGLLLLGGAMISVGLFISALTESQVVAAVSTFAVSIGLLFVEMLSSGLNNEIITTIINGISFSGRYREFTQGIFNISNFLYFISVIVIFNFLTVRIIEKRRWA